MQASSILAQVPDLIASGGYGLLGGAIILEGLPVLGSLIPGHVLIVTAGFFAKLGILNIYTVLAVAILSAILGDIVGFMIGRKWGEAFIQKMGKRLYVKEEYIERTRQVLDKHTGKAIIFGKFSPITRPFIAFLVGASRISTKTFWFYNAIGGTLWATVSVLIGYIFGASYPVLAEYFGKFILWAIIGSVLIIWGYRVVNSRFHIFKRYELFMLSLNLISLWALLKTIQDSLSQNSFLANFDIYVNMFMAQYVSPVFVKAAAIIGIVGDTEVFFILGLIVGITFLMKSKWRRAGILILSVSSTVVAVQWAKAFFMRARPVNALEIGTGASFPSGHASLSAAFFVACLYVFLPRINSWVWRELLIVSCVALIIVVGISRLLLNIHWASDVIAGWSLGIFLATGSVLLVRYVGAVLFKDTR